MRARHNMCKGCGQQKSSRSDAFYHTAASGLLTASAHIVALSLNREWARIIKCGLPQISSANLILQCGRLPSLQPRLFALSAAQLHLPPLALSPLAHSTLSPLDQ